MVVMKLGVFIMVSLCVSTIAHADHARAIERYRKAYEAESDPRLLVAIAHEYRKAGNVREALAYFCSYMYVDAAGERADEASDNARAISAKLGNPTQSDHEACSPRPPASRASSSDVLPFSQQVPPRISTREIVGLSGLAGSLAFLGLALYEARALTNLGEDMRAAKNDPSVDFDALADREDSARLRQKLYLVAGGAALITGGILYVTGRNDRKKAERALIAPTVTKNGAGLVYGRTF